MTECIVGHTLITAILTYVQRLFPILTATLILFTACAGSGLPEPKKEEVIHRIDAYGLKLDYQLINYFTGIAFGSEYSGGNVLVSWNQPVKIRLLGSYSKADSSQVRTVIYELDRLLPTTNLRLVEHDENISLLFTDQQGFDRYAPSYANKNAGYFRIRWHPKTKYMTGGRILVRSAGITQVQRNHVIREEITQVLGLMRDSDIFQDSIFYQEYSETDTYSVMDKRVLLLLDALKPLTGHSKEDIERFLYDIANKRN